MTTRIQVIREVGLSFSSRHINCGGDVKNGICNKCRYIFKKGEVAKLTRPGEYLGVYNKETGQYEK